MFGIGHGITMNNRFRAGLAAIAIAFSLAGCAEPARIDQMTAVPTVSLPSTSALRNTVELSAVIGGTSTNPLWVSKVGNPEFQAALKGSLQNAGMLATGPARYRLDTTLVSLDQPMMGFDLTVRSGVQYVLTDTTTNNVVFNRPVNAEFTAHVGDAFAAVERLRLANEGSIKTNIQTFMDQLIAALGAGVPVSQVQINIAPQG
jgi:hypothetical protein